MWNARLDEAQAGIKVAGRNINNLRFSDDTTLMKESEEELKSLLKVKEEKVGLKLNIQETKIMASSPITSWQVDGEIVETVTDFKVKVKSLSNVWLCETPMDYSLPGSSVHGIFQERILEQVAISSFRGSFWPRGWTYVSRASCIGRQILYR